MKNNEIPGKKLVFITNNKKIEPENKKIIQFYRKKIVPVDKDKKIVPPYQKKVLIHKKKVPADELDEEIVESDEEMVESDEEMVESDEEIVKSDKEIVKSYKELVESGKKIVESYREIVESYKEIVKSDKKIISLENFQFKIFQEINKLNIGNNLMVSPLSIYHILSLIANGAANKTLVEMLQALSEKNLTELNEKNKKISLSISKLGSIELANAVFTRFKPLENFLKIIGEYKAKSDELKNAEQINKWCSDATHQKIPKIIDKITGSDKMVLINAIYFKGTWQQPFDEEETKLDIFWNFNKQPKKVYYMNSKKNMIILKMLIYKLFH